MGRLQDKCPETSAPYWKVSERSFCYALALVSGRFGLILSWPQQQKGAFSINYRLVRLRNIAGNNGYRSSWLFLTRHDNPLDAALGAVATVPLISQANPEAAHRSALAALVVGFRHLHPFAAHSRANAGIKGPQQLYESSGAFEFDI
jgi:hypothetical protein